jgi:hypothetical protein
MKWLNRSSALYRSRIEPVCRSFVIGWDPDVDAGARVAPRSEEIILVGLVFALLASVFRPLVAAHSFHPLEPEFLIYIGIALMAAGWRTRLQRWLYVASRTNTTSKLTKSEIDGALQLSYVLTTAGGLSLVSVHSRWFAVLAACNIFAGIIVLDAARQLNKTQVSEDGITYAVINAGIYKCVKTLLRRQVVIAMIALIWLVVREL